MKELIKRRLQLKQMSWRGRSVHSPVLNLSVIFYGVWWLASGVATATDWTQFQGPNMDGTTPDPIALHWNIGSPSFLIWTNLSLTNGFSSFAVSKGRAFTQISKGSPSLEYCVAVDAMTGTNLWAVPIDTAPWNPASTTFGGDGRAPCNRGDGPRSTPSVLDNHVYALSGRNLHLVCCNVTNGSVIWSNNLAAAFGATTISWENGASPRLDGSLIFVNLNTARTGQTLSAFNAADGSLAWQSQYVGATHSTPSVATIQGVRQVIFATTDGLVSLERDTGNPLWTYSYPFGSVSVAMGAAPVVYSNTVFMTCGYSGGSAAVRLSLEDSGWTVTPLWSASTSAFRNTWMAPVCYQGFLYGQFGDRTWTNTPLKCIELATGQVKWSVANFGMGGTILVHTNLLVVTEDGQIVLAAPNPNAYTELARYRVFRFTSSAPGKCWNSAAYSDGRSYVRSTRGGVSLNVAVTLRTPLRLFPPQLLSATQARLMIGTADGTPISTDRLPGIEVHSADSLLLPRSQWPQLTNPLSLTPDGFAVLTNSFSGQSTQSYYITIEH
jgi:outer membrane protein assembly factor BamB